MSSLSSQLKTIKQNQVALKIAPNQQQPTILFDKFVARNTSIDTIYSMAIIAYNKLQKSLANNLDLVHNRQYLLSEELKAINRNNWTKDQNSSFSQKIEIFLLELSPFLLNAECQQVLQYLLRNFKINVFQAETLSLVFLQYWNYDIYRKILQNISKKQMTGKLSFLNQITSSEQINFTFIIKTLTYSHLLLDRLVSMTLQSAVNQSKRSEDQSIVIGQLQNYFDQSIVMIKHPIQNFLLKIFLHLIKQKRTDHFRYIIQFCSSCLRVRDIENNKQLVSLILILIVNLLVQNGISQTYLKTVCKKLFKRFSKKDAKKSIQKQVFDFIMVIWQRKKLVIDNQLVQQLAQSAGFLEYFKNSISSKYMIFHNLFQSALQGIKCMSLLEAIGVSIKNQQFYKLHQKQFINSIFDLYESSSSQKGANTISIQAFIKKNYKHQYAVYVNEAMQNQSVYTLDSLKKIFQAKEIKKNNTVQVQNIPKVLPEKKRKQVFQAVQQNKIQSQSQQEEQPMKEQKQQSRKTNKKSLVEHLRLQGINCEKVDFEDQLTKQALKVMFYQSYNSKSVLKINSQQKNIILDNLGLKLQYSTQMLRKDLNDTQFITPVKYMLQAQIIDIKFLQIILESVNLNKKVLDDILFRQLLRLTLQKMTILAQTNYYKQIMGFLGKFYKQLLSGCKSILDHIQINNFMLKISSTIFEGTGNNKGKYQSMIHSHCKLLSSLIINIETVHEDGPIISLQSLKDTYYAIIRIFGAKQLYLINIGIIELITRREMNYQKLKYFVQKIMLPIINFETQQRKEQQQRVGFLQHAQSVGKQLVFCCLMMDKIQGYEYQPSDIDPIFTSGIAKNQVSTFYGLIRQKLKKNVIKKIFLFLKVSFQSKRFISSFKNYLASANDKELQKILHTYSQIYKILLSIDFNDEKIVKIIEKMLDSITNLFSLDMRLVLFEPLLPNKKLYGYLAEQLQKHAEADFRQLSKLAIIPQQEINMEWISFAKQVLKRGHKLNKECLQSVFESQHLLSNQNNFQCFSQLICYLSDYDKDSILPYINESMNIILAVCATGGDYCLALLYKVITNLKQLVDPYVENIMTFAVQNQSDFVDKFLKDTVQHLTTPTLIGVIKKLSKTASHYFNFCLLFKYVCQKGIGNTLSKTLQNFASKIINIALNQEEDLSLIYQMQSEIFLQMSLKFNESQLRRVLIDFIRWSETKQNQQISIPFNMRKILISSIYTQLSTALGSLFTPFYGYIFQSYLKDINNIVESCQIKEQKSSGKRQRNTQSAFKNQTCALYITKILQSLESLFQNDADNQFLDGTKFDTLSQSLSIIFTITTFNENLYLELTSQNLTKCLFSLCKYLKDDYQLKTLNYKILLLLRLKNPLLQQAIFTFMDKLIDQVQDRYLLFVNDLVPFLMDSVHSRNQRIKRPIKSIIAKVQELSGTRIQSYAK